MTLHISGDLMMILEFCPFGNVRNYLISNRNRFVNTFNDIGEINNGGANKDFRYENLKK